MEDMLDVAKDEAAKVEQAARDQDDYEMMVRCANDEDESGMMFLAKRLVGPISLDAAWMLIDRYQTRGSAY